MVVVRLYLEMFAFKMSLAWFAICNILFFIAVVRPVFIIPMSISPVVGSVAACCIATFTRLMAY